LRIGTPPLILVTNDDGIASLGLRAAVRSVMDLGEVRVIAPCVQQSGQGRSFPHGPAPVEERLLEIDGKRVYAACMDAAPAKVVRLGLVTLLPRLPDLAIAGINYGENLGGCVTVSGTVGAAIETASFGIPTLAASLETDAKYHFAVDAEVDFRAAAAFVRRLAQALLSRGMPAGVDILKLDVPSDATADTPWRTTCVSRQQYFVSNVSTDMQGNKRVSGYKKEIDHSTLESDSDVHAVAMDRVVSVSPMTIDLTAHSAIEHVRDMLESI
jgi:5'-nucleotidase